MNEIQGFNKRKRKEKTCNKNKEKIKTNGGGKKQGETNNGTALSNDK
jgi:hypothetical protein